MQEIILDGFSQKDFRNKISDFAFISLGIALNAYASTYKSFNNDEVLFRTIKTEEQKEDSYNHEYVKKFQRQ